MNYEQLDSWELALAAYNAGFGRVRRMMRSSGVEDFWELRERWAAGSARAAWRLGRLAGVPAGILKPANAELGDGLTPAGRDREGYRIKVPDAYYDQRSAFTHHRNVTTGADAVGVGAFTQWPARLSSLTRRTSAPWRELRRVDPGVRAGLHWGRVR